MSVSQRVIKAREAKNFSQLDLAKASGVSQGTISTIERGVSKAPRTDILSSLAKALDVSLEFLANGNGDFEMALEVSSDVSPSIGERVKSLREHLGISLPRLAQMIDVSQDTIRRLESGKNAPRARNIEKLAQALGTTAKYIMTGNGERLLSGPSNARRVALPLGASGQIAVPFVPIRARATFAEFFDDSSREDEYVQVSSDEIDQPYQASTRCFEVNGDSMDPRLRSGWRVLARQVQPDDWRYIGGGQVYVVLYRSTLVIKTIRDNTLASAGILRLHSENPTGGSTDVAEADLRAIWHVYNVLPHRP